MTAHEIAEVLGCREVTINYRASEMQTWQKVDKVMGNLFWTKKFKDETLLYREYFPEIKLKFKEPLAPADYKAEILDKLPESHENIQGRGVSLM